LACSAMLASTSTSTPAALDRSTPTSKGLGGPARDASGRLLQSTFQRRAPELSLVPDTKRAGDPGDSRHPNRFARRHLAATAALHCSRLECAATLTSLSFASCQCMHRTSRQNQDRFHSRLVKIASFCGPGRLPPASGPSQVVCRTRRSGRARLKPSFHSPTLSAGKLGSVPRPRPQPKWLL
jgi:hypothetical protein